MAGRTSSTNRLPASVISSQSTSLWKPDLWLPLALAAITLLAFSPLFDAEFVRDDPMTITENPAMFGPPSEIGHFWTNLKSPTGDIYIPLTQTVWYLLARVARLAQPAPDGVRLHPFPFHLANLLLHILDGWIVFRILRKLRIASWAAASGAALYLLHPLQVEVTAWVSGLKDVLGGTCTLAALLAFLCFVEALDARSARSWRWYLLGTLSFIAAMLAKPASVVTPLLAFILGLAWLWLSCRHRTSDTDPPQISSNLRDVFRPMIIPLLIWFAVAIPVVVEGHHAQPADMTPSVALWMRPLVAADALCFYFSKLVAPVSLALDYSRTPAAITQNGATLLDVDFPRHASPHSVLVPQARYPASFWAC